MNTLQLERLAGPREPATANLMVSRGKGWMGRRAAFRVTVDGGEIGRVRYGESQSFSLADGPHVVHLECGGWFSPSLEADLQPGQTTSLSCQPHYALWQGRSAMLHPGEALELTREDPK